MIKCNKCGKRISRGQYYCIFCGTINENNRCYKVDDSKFERNCEIDDFKFSVNKFFNDIHILPSGNKIIMVFIINIFIFLASMVFQLLNISFDHNFSFFLLLYSLPAVCILIFFIFGCVFYYDRYSTLSENISRSFVVLFLLFAITFLWVIQNSVNNPHMLVVIFSVIMYALFIALLYFLVKKILWFIMNIFRCNNFWFFISMYISISYILLNSIYMIINY